MSYDELKAALEALPDPTHCEGKAKLSERLALQLPDGDVGALDDKMFVDWLVEHSEDAPFGHGGETKRDKKVRNAKRLVARGKVDVAGFDPASVLGEIEAVLSPRTHLDAKLVDVVVYEKGGQFAKHKDTPRTPNLVGTLVVGLPIQHEGGQFELSDGGEKPEVIDWSGKPEKGTVRWVALFSDVDHEVKPVKSGARVTLVYALTLSDRPRTDAARDKRLAKLTAAMSGVKLAHDKPLMIACTRLVITDGKQPESIDTLRGTDREIANAFAAGGFDVNVRACLVGSDNATPLTNNNGLWAITRLAKPIPQDVIDGMDYVVSFTDDASADEDYDFDATLLGEYVHDHVWMDNWIVRKRSAAMKIRECMYSETGYFGNEASDGLLYTLAAIEVTPSKGKPKKPAKKAPAKKAPAKKPAAKKPAAKKKKR
jgi:hypothetical protein